MKHPPFLFLHIQKTAGNSMHQILFNNFPGYVSLDYRHGATFDRHQLNKIKKWYPVPLQGIGGHHLNVSALSDLLGPNQFNFTFLRKPLDRYLSFYNYLISKHGLDLNIADYLQQDQYWNTQTRALDASGNLELAKEQLRSLSFVGLFEELPRSLELLGQKLHIDTHQAALNRSKGGISWSDLTKVQQDLCVQNNLKDLDLYALGEQLFQSYTMGQHTTTHLTAWKKQLAVWRKKMSLFYVNKVLLS